eukprot:9333516-Alexandrium_andersonii.AAC.1
MADVLALQQVATAALDARAVLRRPAAAKAASKRPADPCSACPVDAKKPHFSVERTRGQVMCRTGLKGAGQSHAI